MFDWLVCYARRFVDLPAADERYRSLDHQEHNSLLCAGQNNDVTANEETSRKGEPVQSILVKNGKSKKPFSCSFERTRKYISGKTISGLSTSTLLEQSNNQELLSESNENNEILSQRNYKGKICSQKLDTSNIPAIDGNSKKRVIASHSNNVRKEDNLPRNCRQGRSDETNNSLNNREENPSNYDEILFNDFSGTLRASENDENRSKFTCNNDLELESIVSSLGQNTSSINSRRTRNETWAGNNENCLNFNEKMKESNFRNGEPPERRFKLTEHKFRPQLFYDGKRCQLCHDILTKEISAFKCLDCELTCHGICLELLPNIRYQDISFVIFRKWLESQEKYCFPTLHRYLCLKKSDEFSTEKSHSLTDKDCTHRNNERKDEKQAPDSGRLQSHLINNEMQSQNNNDRNGLENPFINGINLRINESNRNSTNSNQSSKNDEMEDLSTNIIVDVHHQSDCEVLLNNKDIESIWNDTKYCVPDKLETQPRNIYACGKLVIEEIDQTALKQTKKHNDYDVGFGQRKNVPKSQSFPMAFTLRNSASDNLRLHYVTQRILASILPNRSPIQEDVNGEMRNKFEKDVVSMLDQKHGKNYRIFDLESCIPIITLERICELCKHIDSWLEGNPEKVVVLQDREDRQRLGIAISAYLVYLDICSSTTAGRNRHLNDDACVQSTIEKNWLDLDIFSMKRFLEDFVGSLKIPSHKRYLKYFAGLLSGKIRMNSSSILLKRVIIETPPMWFQYDKGLSAQSSEWITFIKIYEGLQCAYTSKIHIIPVTTRQFVFEIGNLPLRGDIMIRCYQIIPHTNGDCGYLQGTREILYSLQFHTCAVTEKDISFGREDLDVIRDDFPSEYRITLQTNSNIPEDNIMMIQSPLVKIKSSNEITRYDSVEHFDLHSSCHTQGPIDGSLYATISKATKSSQTPYSVSTSPKESSVQEELYDQCLLSPPAQFSSQERQYNHAASNLFEKSCPTVDPLNCEIVEQRKCLPETNNNKDLCSSKHNSRLFDSCIEIRRSDSQGGYSAANSKFTIPVNLNPSETRDITIVETYNSVQNASSNGNDQPGSHEYVQSPLTLSMDSGISSSGALNRPYRGSSISPSSLPSQASPQEDRHRELDDILSDMLMTVQDIPDFSRPGNNQNQYRSHPMFRSQSVTPSSGNYAVLSQIQPQSQYNTIRRSQSYIIEQSPIQNYSTYVSKERQDIYDTSSTATTLTPPPSESGRDTPIATYSNSSSVGNFAALQHQNFQREKREIVVAPISERESQHFRGDQQHPIMSLPSRGQSSQKSCEVRSNVGTALVSEEEIPYHAREHSQPFSYGNVPPTSFHPETHSEDCTMIKTQSGLSSPSLVRRTLGRSPSPSPTLRKTAQRVDFEEMLRERREKVMNEKYSISERSDLNVPDVNSRSFGSEWAASSHSNRLQNSYPQSQPERQSFEPIRRSNTMDGGFHRSNSTDGFLGQTWLQMQQQKLRAKKDQQHRDDRRYFEEIIHSEIRSRPIRSRANMVRYDGYSSDTAAFMDEVDFRQPLQVQTPYNRDRLQDEIYNKTISTTKLTKERPFVAVKRAHEEAKQKAVLSPPSSPLTMLGAAPNGHIPQLYQEQSGLLTMGNNPSNGHVRLLREESFSSYRSETEPDHSTGESPRPETPAFPVTPRTPYGLSGSGSVSPALPPKSPTSLRKDLYSGHQKGQLHEVVNQNETISCYASRRNSNGSNANSEPQEVAPHLVKFVRDSSKYWYKPNISREDAVALLRKAEPGTFIVRDSTTYKNAFGLVLRVAYPPPGVELRSATGDELVRHFLVEPTSRGVRLKGCNNEPVFSSLSALVYQHSIMPLALPCRLIIPEQDIQSQQLHSPAQRHLLALGAACNVLYLLTCDTESLTGEEAIRKAVSQLFACKPLPIPTEVHFKAAQQGITLTDNTRQKFFRKHYPANSVSFCGLDPEKRTWSIPAPGSEVPVINKTIFAFVARRTTSSKDNQCHVFCDLQSNQPALAIAAFVNKVLPTDKQVNHNI
ncbi:uncharacterized protein LOC119658310 isoform X4 [Hermetia illucens]|uniref:uncharacterized protein LOC119658310 isoform X4 n=1 Tax=Hermetia illucens TaxID=343691 RepID=UPI0018CC6509|nr:uncharacterized protein LOC119658310 isoform X4 [Hermetia illucens]